MSKSLKGLVFGQLQRGGGLAVANTVAPAISPLAVIGTPVMGDDGTWNGASSFTYQWQRNTGSWADIGGATAKNYTPTDVDFGCALRLVVMPSPSGSPAYSNATALVVEAPTQSFGLELVTNGDMETGDPPSNWTTFLSSVLASVADERTGGAGVQSAGVTRGSNDLSLRQGSPAVAGSAVIWGEAWGKNVSATNLNVQLLFGGTIYGVGTITSGAWTRIQNILRPSGATSMEVRVYIAGSTGQEGRVDDVGFKLLTPNSPLTAPSANMRIDTFYTLPGTPVAGTQVWVMPRLSDFANGNYWNALLLFTGSQWDITLYSVAAYARTSRIAASNIGASNGIRVNMNADSISLFTTGDDGENWTQRGSTITNSTYQTATSCNVLASPDVTLDNLVYAPAD